VKPRELKTIKCPHCNGKGELPGTEAGALLRLEREEKDVNRNQLLEFFGYSESYTIDLERGARPLTWELVDKYRTAVVAAVHERLKAEVV